jgi:preprotein translocase, SecE subunit, bacterial
MANKDLKNKEKKNSFKSMKSELKKVIWPTPKQLVNNTIAVVAIVAVVSAIVFVLDFAFESANKYGVDKIKQAVVSTETNQEENSEENKEEVTDEETTTETETSEETPTEESADAE